MTLAEYRIHKRRSVIRRIATDAARNVTAGGCNAEAHNIRTIEHAIIEALNWKPKRRKR